MADLYIAGIVCAIRHHGEHGAVVRLLTPDCGLMAGYVRGGRSRTLRPILLPSNIVQARFRARNSEQLASLTVELTHSYAPIMTEPLAADALAWVCALTAGALPDAQPFGDIYTALTALLAAIAAAPSARGWGGALVRYELLLLERLGFAPQLDECIATGARDDLIFVSPKAHQAVSRQAAQGHEDRLLPLPAFFLSGDAANVIDVLNGFKLTGYYLEQFVFSESRPSLLATRERLIERWRRVSAP